MRDRRRAGAAAAGGLAVTYAAGDRFPSGRVAGAHTVLPGRVPVGFATGSGRVLTLPAAVTAGRRSGPVARAMDAAFGDLIAYVSRTPAGCRARTRSLVDQSAWDAHCRSALAGLPLPALAVRVAAGRVIRCG